jgi:hypothetical protein
MERRPENTSHAHFVATRQLHKQILRASRLRPDGRLIYYGPNFADLFRRAADYVDKILRGRKPADLPIEQPTKFDLVVNLATAEAKGTASLRLLTTGYVILSHSLRRERGIEKRPPY